MGRVINKKLLIFGQFLDTFLKGDEKGVPDLFFPIFEKWFLFYMYKSNIWNTEQIKIV